MEVKRKTIKNKYIISPEKFILKNDNYSRAKSKSDDVLIECSREALNEMLKHLENHLPQMIQQYNLICQYLYYFDSLYETKKRENIYSDRWNQKLYTHRKGNLKNCTLIALTGEKDYMISVFTLESSKSELKECLLLSSTINWHNNYRIYALCNENLIQDICAIADRKNTNWICLPIFHILHISRERIMEYNVEVNLLPSNIYMAPLNAEKHSKFIADNWEYTDIDSLNLIKQSIELNGGLGLFSKDAADQLPISWILTTDQFTTGFLHTVPSERCKGYGKFIKKAELQRFVRLHNLDMYAFVRSDNAASLALHKDMGFEMVNRVAWIKIQRKS